jgi:1-acyl-sn-glycerol-3-phosphate acyltransferase
MLGALIEGSFIAKTEVGTWPFFGTLARLQRTVFVDRKPKNAAEHRDSIQGRLEQGDSLILFPEGTSSDGNRTLPFKSALFSVASIKVPGDHGGMRAITVQPVSITCTALDGIPLGHAFRPFYAWYGDMSLLPHLWTVAGLGRLTVAVEFHPAVRADAFVSRKALAQHCSDAISAGVRAMISGRRPPPNEAGANGRAELPVHRGATLAA